MVDTGKDWPPALDLPADLPRPALRDPEWRLLQGRLPAELSARVDAPDCLAAFAVFVGKAAGAKEFALGVEGAPYIVELRPVETFVDLARRLGEKQSPLTPPDSADPARHPLFDASFGGSEPLGDLHLRVQLPQLELFYDARLFSDALAERLARAYTQVLESAAQQPHATVASLGLLSAEEAEQQLRGFSSPVFNWPRHLLLHQLFEAKADQTPHATALVFGGERISYGELEARANVLAAHLVERGVGPDDIIALFHERTPEMIVSILGVLKAGGAYLPIEPDAPPERVRYLLEDSGANLALTTAALSAALPHPQQLLVDQLQGSAPRLPQRAQPQHLAYVIYTSGSTGKPKGVLVEHRNVVHLVLAEKDDFGVRGDDALALLSSYTFDASVDQIWLALASGARLLLLAKETLLDANALTRALATEGVTHLDAVPGLLAQLSPQALPKVARVVVGGEACPPSVAKAWSAAARFYNEYGPTETTVGSLRHLVSEEPGGKVPIGRPIGSTRPYVLDWGGCPVPPGVRGELHIGGAGVARGYLNRDELTRERFVPDPFDAGARMYRTGDRVAWRPDGSIDFHGRADDQVKLRGFRVELGEIENAVLAHADISEAAVGLLGERLVCHLLASRSLSPAELRAFLARSLPAYMIPDFFVQLDAFPRTPSGKIDRRRLPAPQLAEGPVEEPANQLEATLREIWSELLKVPPQQLPLQRSFFELGGHSLLVMQMVARLHERVGVTLAAATVLAAPTIREIAAAVAQAEKAPLPLAAAGLALPATPVQRRMYVIQQANPRSTSYNIPLLYEVKGRIDESALAAACAALVQRHEALRTGFFFQEGQILAKIAEHPPFALERYSLDEQTLESASTAFVRPFALEAPPLFRAAVFLRKDAVRYLALDMHHSISDGTSVDALLEDLRALLEEREPAAKGLSYFDFAAWLESEPAQKLLAKARAYWSEELRDELPVLELPADFRRPLSRQQAAGEVTVQLDAREVAAIAAAARAQDATPFALHAAAYSLFLSCLTGSGEVVFGFPSAGRPHPGFARTVGMFVNTLVFRARIDPAATFADLVRACMQQIRAALAHEQLPFEDLVDELRMPAAPGRNPVFDTMLSYEGELPAEHRCGEAVLREKRLQQQSARMDLVLVIREDPAGGAALRFEYSADLFKRATVERLAREFKSLLSRALEAPAFPLAALGTLSSSERARLLHGFNETAHDLPDVSAAHQLFERSADARPDAIAVEMEGASWTYAEVEGRANALAARLRALGVGRDSIVGILLDPCMEMLVSVLGVLKAGGAFMPIDPDYPPARKEHMLRDSGTKVLLTRGALGSAFDLKQLDLSDQALYAQDRERRDAGVQRGDLAYVIYTSGSTGQPKGTLIEHRGLLNFSCWYADRFRIQPGDGVSKYAGFGFDASISEIAPAFVSGARLVIVPPAVRLSLEDLDAYFAAHEVKVAFLPTQFGEQFFRHATKHAVRAAFLGGEKLRSKPTDRCEIVNGYGPTEYTVAATSFGVDKAYDNIPIGKPLWNTRILILDKLGRLCPVGVAGELCISGASMARGYLNQPALTAEKFVDNPFAPGERMYRSGDLARWLEDGNLEFLGRIDTQVKVRGFRIELGEIEQALMALPSVREAVALARENPRTPGDLSLVAFVTCHTDASEETLKGALGRTLPAYMVPLRIVQLEEIPLTANGKVDRRRLPEVALDSAAAVQPRNDGERALRRIYAQVLGAPEESIGVETSFLDLGGHSLKAAVLLSAIYRETGRQLKLADFLKSSSVAEVARELASPAAADVEATFAPAPAGPLALSPSQRRIYAVHQLSSWSTAYNIPFAWELSKELDAERLARALPELVRRHQALRASFTLDAAGAPLQQFADDARLEVERLEVDDANLRVTLERLVRPFDLAKPPLLRAALVRTPARLVLAFDVHHIVADGLSVRVLLEELEALYHGRALATAAAFADYVAWETGAEGQARRDEEKPWWLAKFAEHPSPLELPCDFDRPPRQDFEGDEVATELSPDTARPLLELARARNITPLGVFLSAWAVVLSRLGNTPEVVIGVPAAGRNRRGTERLVGMFVNTVPLRLTLRKGEPFSALCVRIGREAAEAFDRQSYQLNDLVADLGLSRDPSRNPLFDVLFAWEDEEIASMEGSSLGLRELPAAQPSCKFDLELTVQNRPGGLRIALLFARKLFRKPTAERFLGHLRSVLEQAARLPDSPLEDFSMLQPWERQLLLEEFNQTAEPAPKDATLFDLFLDRLHQRPTAVAAEDEEGILRYEDIDVQSSALAAALAQRGVQSGDVVALCMHRSRRLLVAIAGVHRAGAGYLPIEPDTPPDRVALILEDSGARVLLSDAGVPGALAWDAIDLRAEIDFPSRARPDGIAYVIYTSGSTGKPKGVVIEHRSVVNFLETSRRALGVGQDDRVLLFSSFTFDASVAQIGLALAAGARLIIPRKETLLDHDAFEKLLAEKAITHLDAVPLFLSGFTPKHPLRLDRIVVGGDICPTPVAERWSKGRPLYNEYGPTETTITSLRHQVTDADLELPRLPIGRPVANTRVYLLDWTGNLAPLGVPGEMYIGGAGVARGYLNNEALTRERFLPSPFVPGDRLYKTGDIARWTSDGLIDFLGRADNQVKIRGFRIELGEIEAALLRHPAVAEAAVIVRARGDDKRLCGYAVLKQPASAAELRSFLSRSLPSYMVPDAVVPLPSLPVTVSGKVDRKRLPEPSFDSAGAQALEDQPRTPAEERLVDIWSEVLKLPRHRIPATRSFFELGGHSLLIMILITRVQQVFTVRLQPADVFDKPTLRGLAQLIEEHERQPIVPIPKAPEHDRYPLSSVQRRMFAIQQANPLSVSYNVPTVFAVEGQVTPERLEEVVRALIHRHASLRTSFAVEDGEPRARIHANAPFSLQITGSAEPLDELMQRLMQPFDLAQAPLLRVWLVRRPDLSEHLVIDLHHIAIDGYSLSILWTEVSEILRGVVHPAPRIHYGDFALWQQSAEHAAELRAQRDFWRAQFAELPPPLQLPLDFRRPAVRSNAGDLVVARLSREELARLTELSRGRDSTLFATLLSAWFVFLSRIGGQHDLVVGVPVSGRSHPDLQEMVGMFVNTVPWRAQVPESGSFLDFLTSTRATSLQILDRGEYPLEDLLADLDVRPAAGQNPLFDAMFVFEPRAAEVIDAGRVKLRFEDFLHRTAKVGSPGTELEFAL